MTYERGYIAIGTQHV